MCGSLAPLTLIAGRTNKGLALSVRKMMLGGRMDKAMQNFRHNSLLPVINLADRQV